MIYWVRTLSIPLSLGNELGKAAMAWLEKLVKFNNETWPGVEAELMTNFDGSTNVVHLKQKFESISACVKHQEEWWQNEEAKVLWNEYVDTSKNLGQHLFKDDIQDHYYNIVEIE